MAQSKVEKNINTTKENNNFIVLKLICLIKYDSFQKNYKPI